MPASDSILLSIIVPVYNVEKTLNRCVDSILMQIGEDAEILLIDDGSRDSSVKIADQYADEHENVRVFHKQNGGLSDARNYGLKHALGQYILFVDSDDELAVNTIESLLVIAAKHPEFDIVEFPVKVHAGHSSEYDFIPADCVYEQVYDYWCRTKAWQHSWACNKLYKKRIFEDIEYAVGRIFEDVWMLGSILQKKDLKIASISKGQYIYHWNNSGLTSSADKKAFSDWLEAMIRNARIMNIDTHEEQWHGYYMEMLNVQISLCRTGGDIMLHEQKVAVKRYFGINSLIKSILLNILGLRRTCALFSKICK